MNPHVEEARLYSKLPIFKKRIAQANDIIIKGLSQCRTPFVAFSAGKDSAAMLHLVSKKKPDVEARFISWGETHLIDDYDEVLTQWKQMGFNISVFEMRRDCLSNAKDDRWDILQGDSDAVFNGITRNESRARRATLNSHGNIYRYKAGILRICPMSNWSPMDSFAYCVDNNLPILGSYYKYGARHRTVSRIPRDYLSIREDFLNRIKSDDYVAYKKIINMYPDLSGL